MILIDDGSTDATAEMLDELAQYDEKLIVFHKENGGVSTARNLGIRKAKGQYIAFADVDDYELMHFQTLVKAGIKAIKFSLK